MRRSICGRLVVLVEWTAVVARDERVGRRLPGQERHDIHLDLVSGRAAAAAMSDQLDTAVRRRGLAGAASHGQLGTDRTVAAVSVRRVSLVQSMASVIGGSVRGESGGGGGEGRLGARSNSASASMTARFWLLFVLVRSVLRVLKT